MRFTEYKPFPVLSLCREDVAVALANDRALTGVEDDYAPGDDLPEQYVQAAEEITDEGMAYLARKVGDSMMEGGDYWGAIVHWYGEMQEVAAADAARDEAAAERRAWDARSDMG